MISDSSTGEIGKEETTVLTETKAFQQDWAAGVELSVDTDEDIKGVSLMINKDQEDIMRQVILRAEMPTGSDVIGKKKKSSKKDHSNSVLDTTKKMPYTVNSSNYTKSSKHNRNEKLLANYN
ncbi:hypothetical protein GcM1_230046 [Golovinomyces cichoracearum]|uniref:Uncharacterized protein n=1 Tax=Golovinomyces cichoracearum TaxID=62708 RepID=A0A420IN53_9PEZI|nr:hypothetical protein GcM1_230046 [Golovinomyces cichoracearum]